MNRSNEPIISKSQLIAQCCAIKAYTGWHVNQAANICRERSGGQGFLSANRFGLAITGTHSSITAEGDCSVLMMKTVMELMNDVQKDQDKKKEMMKLGSLSIMKGPQNFPTAWIFKGISFLKNFRRERYVDLFKMRYGASAMNCMNASMNLTPAEAKFIKGIGGKLEDENSKMRKRKVQYHQTASKNQPLIQKMANDWVEWFVLDSFKEAIEQEDDENVREVLWNLHDMYALDCIKNDLGYFQDYFLRL